MEPAGGMPENKRKKRGPYKKKNADRMVVERDEGTDPGVVLPDRTRVSIPRKEVEKVDEELEALRVSMKNWVVKHPKYKFEPPDSTNSDLKMIANMDENDLMCLKRQTSHYVTSQIDEGLSVRALETVAEKFPWIDSEKFKDSISDDKLLLTSTTELIAGLLGEMPDILRTAVLLGFHIIKNLKAHTPALLNNGTASAKQPTETTSKRTKIGSATATEAPVQADNSWKE